MRRVFAGVVAVSAAVGMMGAGGQPATAPAVAVVTAYYADLSTKSYTAACGLLSTPYIKAASHALLRSGHDKADANAAISRPSPATCAKIFVDVVAIEKVNIGRSRNVKVASAHLAGNVVTVKLAGVPGAGGSTTHLSALVTHTHGRWVITGFST
jgi:hypothetical protein